jgi:hypothetical protein
VLSESCASGIDPSFYSLSRLTNEANARPSRSKLTCDRRSLGLEVELEHEEAMNQLRLRVADLEAWRAIT